eukprot:2861063-Alexandrium_andersonii.AAC.1
MSASLVGSEMCIRDRPETVAQDVPVLADAVPDTRLAAPAEQQASSSSAAAVPAPTVMQDLSQQFVGA